MTTSPIQKALIAELGHERGDVNRTRLEPVYRGYNFEGFGLSRTR